MTLHLAGENSLLALIAVLEKLLDHVVAEDIRHQLHGVRLNLLENALLLVAVSSLQLLLDETRAVLIAAEFTDVVVDILEPLEVTLRSVCSSYLELVALAPAVVLELIKHGTSKASATFILSRALWRLQLLNHPGH